MNYGRLDIAGDKAGARQGPRAEEASRASANLTWARALFVVFAIGVVLRIFFTDALVNLFWPYTDEGGAFPAKIHPGSYFIFASAGLLYFSPGYRFALEDIPVLRGFIVFIGGAIIAAMLPMVQGRNGPAGYVIDVYLVTCAACIFLMAMPPKWRQTLGIIVLLCLGINASLSIAEFVSGKYIIPVEAAEFRPTAFLGAALNVGVMHVTASVFVTSLPIKWYWKLGLVGVLMAGLLISASRTALLVSMVVLPVSVLITAKLRKEGMSPGVAALLLLLCAVTVLPVLYFLVSELGFLDRFKGGYIDDSAQTRIDIYRVFEFVSWQDIWLGTDILRIRKIAQDLLGIELIESAIVFFVFDFGLVCALLFVSMFLWLIWRIARNSHPVIGLGLVIFVMLALTNNTLSTKVPSTFAALVLAISLSAFHSGRRAS